MTVDPPVPPARELAQEPLPAPPSYRWHHKLRALIFIVFCLELGMFLLIFPWSELWDRSLVLSLMPAWRPYWLNPYLRGAVSGLGVLNLYISLLEIFRLRRFTRS
jgi:hypothetical protein